MVGKVKVPAFKDKLHRYRDDQGLWRRLFPDCYQKGELKGNWQPKNGKSVEECLADNDGIERDEIGFYYIAKNDVRVYVLYNV